MDDQRLEEIARKWSAAYFEIDEPREISRESPLLRMVLDAIREALSAQGEELRSLREERDALAQWSCASCGARFPQTMSPQLLDGVTRCSACVRAEVAEAEVDRLKVQRGDAVRRAKAVLDERNALQSESEGRLKALNAKADEARSEWIRAENAEAELLRLRSGLLALDRYIADGLDGELLRVADVEAFLAPVEEKVT
jgi:hypothetical protein